MNARPEFTNAIRMPTAQISKDLTIAHVNLDIKEMALFVQVGRIIGDIDRNLSRLIEILILHLRINKKRYVSMDVQFSKCIFSKIMWYCISALVTFHGI